MVIINFICDEILGNKGLDCDEILGNKGLDCDEILGKIKQNTNQNTNSP